ncbi:hypothetical protein KXR53_15630 [Inquilinus limosus]|uniref:hypothetical protein n=1 Tax=Inquilinus limosus TaxID=171674 RepID=UPI003F15AA92
MPDAVRATLAAPCPADVLETMPTPQAHPWLEPLWVRLLIVVFLIAALAAELLWLGDRLWLFLWGAALVYAVWDFFLRGIYGKPKD